MVTPDLTQTVPKTITAIGKLNTSLNLPKIFDVLPLFAEDGFRVIRYKHEGIMRESCDQGIVKESDTEFKNSITMEIEDTQFGKVRAIKLYCGGIHMCGHRSVERAKRLCEIIIDCIYQTDKFIHFVSSSDWTLVETHPWYPLMKPVILSILPPGSELSSPVRDRVKCFFQTILQDGGLFQRTSGDGSLQLLSLETVMVNYSYTIDDFIKNQFKQRSKENFIKSFVKCAREMEIPDFQIFIHYDGLTSPMGWSGSVPLKFVHNPTGKTQWMTLQMRRGTVINSGPNIEIMQKAVDILYRILGEVATLTP